MLAASSQYYGICGNGALTVLRGGRRLQFASQTCAMSVAASEAHERRFASGHGGGCIMLWDWAASDGLPVVKKTAAHAGDVTWLEWSWSAWASAASQQLAATSWDGVLKLWHVAQSDLVEAAAWRVEGGENRTVYDASWHPVAPRVIATAAAADGAVRVIDTSSRDPVASAPFADGVEALSVDWDKYNHNRLAAAYATGAIALWDWRSMSKPLWTLRAHEMSAKRARFSPHAPSRLATCSYDGCVATWQLEEAEPPAAPLSATKVHSEFAMGLAWSIAEPGVLATCGFDSALFVWSERHS